MKVLTYTYYIEHFELYTEIHGLIAFNSFQIELARKDMILVSDVDEVLYKAGTYSIDDFNAKIKTAALKISQNW